MGRIKTVAFDMGGVVFAQSYENSLKRFAEIGLRNPENYLHPFHQTGIVGAIEDGTATADDFVREMSRIIGRQISFYDCVYAITGYCDHLPQRNLDAISRVREMGYRTVLLSNTNPFMIAWADSEKFDGHGNPISHYFDYLYLSYRCGCMKPSKEIFDLVCEREGVRPDEILFLDDSRTNADAAAALGWQVMCPEGNSDWTVELFNRLNDNNLENR